MRATRPRSRTKPARKRSRGNENTLDIKIASFNASGWRSALRYLEQCDADMVCIQEHRTASGPTLVERKQMLVERGWSSIWAAAVQTTAGSVAGGTLIAVRSPYGLRPDHGEQGLVEGRVVTGSLDLPGRGPIAVGSVYLEVSTKLGKSNLESLAALGQWACQASGVWLLGGDFNMTPSLLRVSGFVQRTRAQVRATTRPTCKTSAQARGSKINFFMHGHRLLGTSPAAYIDKQGDYAPHRPIFCTLAVDVSSIRYSVLKKVPKLTLQDHDMIGPRPRPEDWTETIAMLTCVGEAVAEGRWTQAQVDVGLERAYDSLARKASKELGRLSGQAPLAPQRARGPLIRQVAPEAAKARAKSDGWKSLRRTWLWLRNRLSELVGLLDTLTEEGPNFNWGAQLEELSQKLSLNAPA